MSNELKTVIDAIKDDMFSASELREIIEVAQVHITQYYAPRAVPDSISMGTYNYVSGLHGHGMDNQ